MDLHAYVCPNCAARHWSRQARKSLTRTCLACLAHGRHYRLGTPEADETRARVGLALDEAYGRVSRVVRG